MRSRFMIVILAAGFFCLGVLPFSYASKDSGFYEGALTASTKPDKEVPSQAAASPKKKIKPTKQKSTKLISKKNNDKKNQKAQENRHA